MFREGSAISDFVIPRGRSILAGCKTSVAFTRCLLYNTLDSFHRNYRPSTISSWVDDLSQTISGPVEVIGGKLVDGARFLVDGLVELGCEISTKTTMIASCSQLLAEAKQQLEEQGIVINTLQLLRILAVILFRVPR